MKEAYDNLQRALAASVVRHRAMTHDDVLRAGLALIAESGVEFSFDTEIGVALRRLAGMGSIEAVAVSVALGIAPEADLVEMLKALVMRSPDVKDGAVRAGLTEMIEQFFEEEIAAGRMTKRRCPKTGDWLYENVEDAK